MTYARIENGTVTEYPVYEGDIKSRFPNTSFPRPFIPPSGYEAVANAEWPSVNWDQNVKEVFPERLGGVLTRTWAVEQATQDQIAERTQAQADTVRSERNQRLVACDWTQLPDAPVASAEWATYRQDLRDISSQPGFPWDVQWPEEPS